MLNPSVLRKARLAAGLSYREVGQAAGLDQSAIAHYEAGRVRPSPDAASRWGSGLQKLLCIRLQNIAQAMSQL